jgi:hypothetical protein
MQIFRTQFSIKNQLFFTWKNDLKTDHNKNTNITIKNIELNRQKT